MRHLLLILFILISFAAPCLATTLTFTVNASEPVTVTGTPRIAVDVGGVTRYATYVSGSGSSALTFGYQVQAGDFDADGISLVSPIDLNGATITDLSGNPATSLGFALPDTTGLRIQTYTAAFTSTADLSAASFTIAKAPAGASFSYAITSSGGAGSVTGSGTIGGISHTVSGIDVSNLAPGTLTLSVTVSNASGTGAARTATVTPGFAGALDGLLAATTAYSMRRLRAAYAGPLLRARRAADNAEQDIGFTISGKLDTAALASFCGAGSCFVSTWYDQSGNSRHAAQATPASQPRIVNAGAVETANGRPSLRFLPGTLLTTSAAATWLNGTAYGINAVSKLAAAPGFCIMVTTGTCCTGATFQFGWKNSGAFLFSHYGGGNDAEFSLSPNLNLQIYSGDKLNAAGSTVWINGASIGTSGAPGSYLATSAPLRLGGGIINVYDASWNGWISEVMTFGAQLGSSRTTLEANQKAWYGTP